MTLEQLRIFVVVAEREHITRAAEALNLTQSAVSSAIAMLEARHAVALFDRVGRSIFLNDTGRAFLPEARGVLDRARAAEAALDDLSALRRGKLSIMASQTIASYWLPEHLAAYRLAYPQIEIDVRFANTDRVADAVETGQAELGLVEGIVDRAVITSQVLADDEMVVVVAGDYPGDGSELANQLAALPWIAREEGSGTREAFDTMMAGQGVQVILTLPGNEAVLGAVESGLGATLMSRAVARARLAAGTLQIVEGPVFSRSFYLLQHRERYRTKAAGAFIEMVDRAGAGSAPGVRPLGPINR